jgi:uncharacterized protein (UPF0333 family)
VKQENINKGAIKIALSLAVLLCFLISIYLVPIARTQSDEEFTYSTANITKQVAISKSANLTAGIKFGTVTLGSNNNNATGNFNSTGQTQYWITIDSTTNVDIDLCIKVDQALTSGSYTIPNTNYHYSYNDTTNDWTYPTYPATTEITTSYVKTVEDKWIGGVSDEVYFRFNLDIPNDAHAGDYSNIVYFKAVDNTTSC